MNCARRSSVVLALSAVLVVASPGPTMLGQSPATAPIKALVTSNDALVLGSTFELPAGSANNDAGDYVFASSSRHSALFLRRAGAPSPVRVIQAGDPVPGVAHSMTDLVTGQSINADGLVAFGIEYFGEDTMRGAVLTYDGTSLATIALATDIAPDSGGAMFGRSPILIGLNDRGDVAFTAPLIPVGSPPRTPSRTTIYIAPGGAEPVRITGLGDAAPDTDGTISSLGVSDFNNQGEVLFRAAISGGSGGFGLFVGSTAGVRKIVAHGDPHPGGGTFDLTTANLLSDALLNNEGWVAFRTQTEILVSDPSGTLTVAVSPAMSLPSPLDARSLNSIDALNGFNDSRKIFFRAKLTGDSASNEALFRYEAGLQLEIVAYRGQEAPGTGNQTFFSLSVGPDCFNNAGDAAFYSSLRPGGSTGLFRKTDGDDITPVALTGQSAPSAVGGTYSPSASLAMRILGDGTVYFDSGIHGGTPTYASFLAGADSVQVLVTDADPLPAGSRIVFSSFNPSGAGTYAGFTATRAGGAYALLAHNMETGFTRTVAKPGDPFPSPGGPPLASLGNKVYLNANGDVVFAGSVGGVAHLFVWDAAHGVRKLVRAGDPVPDTALTFTSCTLPGQGIPQINSAGRVAFKGNYQGGSGLFVVAAADTTAVAAVRTGDQAPTGGTFTALRAFAINDEGNVAFSATTSEGTTGVFVVTPGSAALKVVAAGDSPTGGTGTVSAFTSPAPAAFNAAGSVVFYATLTDGRVGLFAGTAGAGVHAVAVSGDAAPAGGNYAFTNESLDVRTNDAGDVLFQAPLTGGTADSGLFLRRANTATIESVAVQGQVPAGAAYPLATIHGSINGFPGETFLLGPRGEVLFHYPLDVDGRYVHGLFRYHGTGTLERLIVRGDVVPDSGGGTAGVAFQGGSIGAPGLLPGLFLFPLMIVDGSFDRGLYAADVTPPTVSAAADRPTLWPPNRQIEAVTISGTAADDGSGVSGTQGTYEVRDEYGLVQPSGTFTEGPSGSFSFVVNLETGRRASDADGRIYTVQAMVHDAYGNSTPATVRIVVQHDRRR